MGPGCTQIPKMKERFYIPVLVLPNDCKVRIAVFFVFFFFLVEPGKTTEVKPNNVPINKLPEDVASDMKNCALSASWHCANTRFGHDAAADKMNFEKNADSFKMKLSGKLLADTCDEIKWMFWNAAWFTANTRVGYTTDAVRDKAAMEKHYRNYVKRGEMTVELADNIKWMGWRAAWYCANFRKGYHNDASKDEEAYKSHFNNIFG